LTINDNWLPVRGKVAQCIELLMLRHDGGFVSLDDIMDYLYDDDPDFAEDNIVSIFVMKARHVLKKYDIGVENRYGFGWRLVNRPRVFIVK